jgi:hypothetical protein
MKPIIKQLIVSALILALVTVLSFGIRHVRFSAYRVNTTESLIVEAEPDHYPADSYTIDDEPDPQYTDVSDWEVDGEPDSQYANAWDSDKEAPFDYQAKPKSFKSDYTKPKGSKRLEKLSLGDHENLFLTVEGELWYVSKQPDGKTVKMQVHIDDTTSEMIFIDAKFADQKDLERISLGDHENLYLTRKGELWYVSEPPDGETVKMPALIDDTGEIIVVDMK